VKSSTIADYLNANVHKLIVFVGSIILYGQKLQCHWETNCVSVSLQFLPFCHPRAGGNPGNPDILDPRLRGDDNQQ
jgi:hypothetical protein